ncbi:hypothetical protein TRVL_00658 [Trypanosoma vivax]|nr:hypothetical protein TRVL_00658 [Trypanosoma vivax]
MYEHRGQGKSNLTKLERHAVEEIMYRSDIKSCGPLKPSSPCNSQVNSAREGKYEGHDSTTKEGLCPPCYAAQWLANKIIAWECPKKKFWHLFKIASFCVTDLPQCKKTTIHNVGGTMRNCSVLSKSKYSACGISSCTMKYIRLLITAPRMHTRTTGSVVHVLKRSTMYHTGTRAIHCA